MLITCRYLYLLLNEIEVVLKVEIYFYFSELICLTVVRFVVTSIAEQKRGFNHFPPVTW